jgi:hypothetical protein
LQQAGIERAAGQLRHIGSMRGREQSNAAAQNLMNCIAILLTADLIHREELWIHGTQKHHNRCAFRRSYKDIRVSTEIKA